MRTKLNIKILTTVLLLMILLGCQSTRAAVIQRSPANSPPVFAQENQDTPAEGKKAPSESHIFPSSKDRPTTKDAPVKLAGPQLLWRMEGVWLPLNFLRDVQKKGSLLDVNFFPPIASISVLDGVAKVTLTSGREIAAKVSTRKKQTEINVLVGQSTHRFIFKGSEFVWDVGQRKNTIVYRKHKDPLETYHRLLNEAMIAGNYYSVMSRRNVIFYDNGRVAGLGKRYNRYRLVRNQQELDRSSRRFDMIHLFHSSAPNNGRWFALVPDERNKTLVIARIRENENQWYLSSTAYMLKPVG